MIMITHDHSLLLKLYDVSRIVYSNITIANLTHTHSHTHILTHFFNHGPQNRTERRQDYGHYFNINFVANPETLKAVERSIKFDESVLRSFTHKIDDSKIFSNPTRNAQGEWKPNAEKSVRGL